MANLRSLPLCVISGALLLSTLSFGQTATTTVRIAGPIDEGQLVTLTGNVHPAAIAKNDRGPVSASLPMGDLVLVLSRSPEQQAAFEAYIQSEYDEGSPSYHQWLAPDQVGERFGPAQTDISSLSNWLSGHGFQINEVSKDRMTIRFSGTAGQVEETFHTQIHNLEVNGAAHIGNMSDPQIPAALATVVVGVKALHNFSPRPLHKLGSKVTFNQEAGKWQRVAATAEANAPSASGTKNLGQATARPQFGIGFPASGQNLAFLEEDVAPYDFATIYNVLPLWQASSKIDGTGQTIAIAGTSDVSTADVATFKSTFGLPAGQTPIVHPNGTDPGMCSGSTNACNSSDLIENTLDVEWSGAVAPGAQVVLVTTAYNSQTNPTNDPVFQSAQYIVNNVGVSGTPVANAHILSVSYGLCELGEGTAGNVSYYNLWSAAAAEGLGVFVATGDAGAPTCDDGGDGNGNPYSAQFGPSVSGLASTPYNTAVGGTDFSWCKPVYASNGQSINGCPNSTSSPGPYWNTSNGTGGASAKGYVPEIPWNDTCENPILAGYLESIAPLVGSSTPTSPDSTCNFVEEDWESIDQNFGVVLAGYVDVAGAGGGASNCVANNQNDTGSCYTATTTGAGNGSIALHNDGWVKPSWQTGVSGIPNDGVRDIPDVSFFAADGALQSAYLICVSSLGSCSPSTTSAQEVGGTSVSTPAMAGVMALINQKAGAAQGLATPGLYTLGGKQTYSACSAESVTAGSASCYFNDVDQGTIAMPCSLGVAGAEGGITLEGGTWVMTAPYNGNPPVDCNGLSSGDVIGTLTVAGSTTTPAYNAGAGFDLATGLGSLNVANVVNGWSSSVGTGTATVTVAASPKTITINQADTVTVTVAGSGTTPTGSVTLSGGGYSGNQTLASGSATFNIPANSLSAGTDTMTANYAGDTNYASASGSTTLTVSVMTPTVHVNAPATGNVANALSVPITVTAPSGATAVPSGTVSLKSGTYSSAAVTLVAGAASFNVPANSLAAGADTLTVTYSGDSNFATATGTASVTMTQVVLLTPTMTVTPTPASIATGQSLSVAVAVAGTSGTPTGSVTLTASNSSYNSGATALTNGSASITIPGNSLAAGTVTLTAAYSGDAVYATATKTGTVTVTASTFTLSATTPAALAPGGSTMSTISGAASSSDYTGVVTLTSCTVTASPSGAVNPPICTISGSGKITYAAGTATGTGTATIQTTASTAMLEPMPGIHKPGSKGWLGAGGGAVLAFLMFLGVPARRRSWRAMLGLVVLLAALGSLSACGGGSISGGGGGSPGTTAGSYTLTVSGQGNDPASTSASTTFTLTVN